VDVIFSAGNGVAKVDDIWFQKAVDDTVLDMPAKLIPPEEMIWSKGLIMERERFDGADVAHVIYARGDQMDWRGVVDRHGGLWFSDLGKRRARDMDVGAFYYIKPGAKEIVEGVFGMLPANGIGLSPDENTVYVAETPTARLWAFDLSAPGTVKPRDVIYRGERGKPIAGLGGYQMFDSLAVEACGNICVATLISGCISVIAPDGGLVEQVPTGDRVTTNIAFGGPELKTAYITLSGKGELVAMDWARPGLPLNFLNK